MKKINKIFKYKNIVVILLITMFFVLDRYLKFLAINFKEDFSIIKDVFKFTFFPNEFISFSIPFSGVVFKYSINYAINTSYFISNLVFRKKNDQ
jgi:lipoprotein signal peptidase